MSRSLCYALVASLSLSACAVSQERYSRNSDLVSDSALCRTAAGDEAQSNPAFAREVSEELGRRGVSADYCKRSIRDENLMIGAGVLFGAAILASAADGKMNRRSETSVSLEASTDIAWREADWDQFYDKERRISWACRDVASGALVDLSYCQGKPQVDKRWPTKVSPLS